MTCLLSLRSILPFSNSALLYSSLRKPFLRDQVVTSFHLRLRNFSGKVESKLTALELSDPFHGRVRNTKDFIDKLKSKARSDCLDAKETDLAEKLSQSNVWDDSKRATDLSQELAAVRERLSEITNLELSLSNTVEMYNLAIEESNEQSDNKDIIQECCDALQQIEDEIEEKAITELMVGKYDKNSSCFLQINAGAGGTEACDWVGMIFRMYRDFSKLNGFTLTIVDENINDEISHVGYRSITLRVKGKNAYFWMKSEAGVHRLVRVSPFDPAKKRHTTFAQVLVYPELEDTEGDQSKEDIAKDLKVDTFRSSGAGGQSVNKTDSAVRITHIPTGLIVTCQNERSQHMNKATAIAILQSRLRQLNKEKRQEVKVQSTIGTGDNSWGNQIRSVVMQPYQMVKDHRTGWETGNVSAFLEGEVLMESLTSTLKHFANVEDEDKQ